MPPIIQVNGLSKNYGDLTAINDISFGVQESALFAFLGPNGAGKSTTINILCTLLEKTKGEILIDGYRISKEDNAIRNLIGVVFQESLLDDLLTVKENMQVRASFYGIGKSEFNRRLLEIAEVLGINEILNRKYGVLSGGQKRRADIARALINIPKILFLDEPTTGLDPQTRLHVWETIKSLQEAKKMTAFLTTHYMEEAAMADAVAIIDHGQIVAQGTPAELRVKYSKDHLKIMAKNADGLNNYLWAKGLKFTQGAGFIDVEVENSMQALAILKETENLIENFEVIRGTMDDVFIKITGREIREGGT